MRPRLVRLDDPSLRLFYPVAPGRFAAADELEQIPEAARATVALHSDDWRAPPGIFYLADLRGAPGSGGAASAEVSARPVSERRFWERADVAFAAREAGSGVWSRAYDIASQRAIARLEHRLARERRREQGPASRRGRVGRPGIVIIALDEGERASRSAGSTARRGTQRRWSPRAISSRTRKLGGEVLRLTNEARHTRQDCGEHGTMEPVASLRSDEKLVQAAQRHAEDMAARETMSHTGGDGSQVGDRITRTGYRWALAGENVAAGQRTPRTVVEDWLESDGHCVNIMKGSFTRLGVGVAVSKSGRLYWAQAFARPR